MTTHKVSEVARLAGVTVRTLHHYDEIGLLRPSGRTAADYRLYDHGDLERLQEILFWRELGLPLDEIQRLMADPDHDRAASLRRQRRLLGERVVHLKAMVAAIDRVLAAHERGTTMNEDDMFELFGDFDPRRHEAEVEERWSGPALEESRRRTSQFTKEQWAEVKAEGDAIAREFGALMTQGVAADSAEAMDVAERHRSHIERFYSCSHQMHRGLGDMYVQDARFTQYWDDVAPGLAPYVRDAIDANAGRAAG